MFITYINRCLLRNSQQAEYSKLFLQDFRKLRMLLTRILSNIFCDKFFRVFFQNQNDSIYRHYKDTGFETKIFEIRKSRSPGGTLAPIDNSFQPFLLSLLICQRKDSNYWLLSFWQKIPTNFYFLKRGTNWLQMDKVNCRWLIWLRQGDKAIRLMTMT